MNFTVTGGQVHDSQVVEEVLNTPRPPLAVSADKAYDNKKARQQIKEDPGIQKVQTQWNQLLDLESKAALASESLTTTSMKLYKKTRGYTGQKPPSNCMALVCQHGKLSN